MKRILVPLDLKTEPDAVAQVVADAARGAGASVRLLHVAPVPKVVEGVDGRILSYADQEAARVETDALAFLHVIEVLLDGIPVEAVVRFGDPTEEILAEADEFCADLIALTTARGAGLRHFLRGGTARRVCRRARTAVMLLQPPALFAA